MTCRPKEFHGEKYPKVTVCWVAKTKQVLRIFCCEENLKVVFSSQMLKGDALTWLNTLTTNLGGDVVSSFTWEVIVRSLKMNFCSAMHKEKIGNELFLLHKGEMSID